MVAFGWARFGRIGTDRFGGAWLGAAGTLFKKKHKAMRNYKFLTPGFYKGLDADAVAAEFDRIRAVYGDLQPEYVVAESKEAGALLHACFQWDDTLAAEAYRREQARQLIKNVYVVVTNEEVKCEVRAFVNVAPAKDLPKSYTPIQEVVQNKDAYDELLAQAKAEMQSFVRKYAQLTELNSVKAEMLKLLSV